MTWESVDRETRKVYCGRFGAVHGLNLPQKFFKLLCNAVGDSWIQYVLLKNSKTGCKIICLCNADELKDLLNSLNRTE
jgi:hypothetical protein